jgi:DNA (cytosine-5)-methyltransferase 1
LKCFSLFSGIGGFDLAAKRLGHKIIGACEIDKYARLVYGEHFPDVHIYDDATKVSPESLPHFDLLCAGFPCQAFSIAGKRLGFNDTRGTLFYEIARIVKEKRPRYLLLENVKGLLSHAKGETLRAIIRVLDEVGYDAEWQVINSKYFVPQNRERIFIIGHLRGESTRQVFPLGEISKLHSKSKESPIVRTLTGGGHSGGLHSQMTLLYHNKSDSQAKRIYNINGVSPNLGTGHAMQSPNIAIPVLTPDRKEKRQNGRRFKEDGDVSFTLTAQDRHGIFDGKKIRRLTPLECERLQGFPDGYTEGISDTQRYKCLGNAVTVPVVEYVISHMTNQTNGLGGK